MNHIRKSILYPTIASIVATMLAPGICARNTQKLTATKATDYGLIYTLPKSEIDITLEAECVTLRPGEFANYAQKYLKSEPITRNEVAWSLISATLSQRSVPDQDARYSVQFKSGQPVTMLLTESGAPLSVNDDAFSPNINSPSLPQAKQAEPTILESQAARQALTEEMMQSTSTAKRAELTAAKIYELRQTRNDIISGNADNMPADGKAMQLMLDNLNAQEEALTAMFLGTRSVSTQVATYNFIPTESDENIIIARISTLDGLVAADDLSGAPVKLSYKVEAKGEMPLTEKGEERKLPKGALAYRINGEASVSVSFDGTTLASQRFKIPQLGVIYGLDPAIFSDKKAPAYVHFDPMTGALLETGAK